MSRAVRILVAVSLPCILAMTVAVFVQIATHRSLTHLFSRAANEGLWVEQAKFTCTARQGEVVRAPFVLHNDSDAPLKVLGAQSSCNCTVTEGTPVEIEAGGTATITLLMKVGAPTNGKYSADSTLFVNREEAGRSLVVEATVVP